MNNPQYYQYSKPGEPETIGYGNPNVNQNPIPLTRYRLNHHLNPQNSSTSHELNDWPDPNDYIQHYAFHQSILPMNQKMYHAFNKNQQDGGNHLHQYQQYEQTAPQMTQYMSSQALSHRFPNLPDYIPNSQILDAEVSYSENSESNKSKENDSPQIPNLPTKRMLQPGNLPPLASFVFKKTSDSKTNNSPQMLHNFYGLPVNSLEIQGQEDMLSETSVTVQSDVSQMTQNLNNQENNPGSLQEFNGNQQYEWKYEDPSYLSIMEQLSPIFFNPSEHFLNAQNNEYVSKLDASNPEVFFSGVNQNNEEEEEEEAFLSPQNPQATRESCPQLTPYTTEKTPDYTGDDNENVADQDKRDETVEKNDETAHLSDCDSEKTPPIEQNTKSQKSAPSRRISVKIYLQLQNNSKTKKKNNYFAFNCTDCGVSTTKRWRKGDKKNLPIRCRSTEKAHDRRVSLKGKICETCRKKIAIVGNGIDSKMECGTCRRKQVNAKQDDEQEEESFSPQTNENQTVDINSTPETNQPEHC